MMFEGIEIKGFLSDFVMNLEEKGFRFDGQRYYMASMRGDFAGYKNCFVFINSTLWTDSTYTIGVALPERRAWSDLLSDYDKLKTLFTAKYDRPILVVERFHDDYKPYDWWKFQCVISEKCTWLSVFDTDRGRVKLLITKCGDDIAEVWVEFLDKLNTDAETYESFLQDI